MSHIRFPEEQLHLFTLPKMYATSHVRPINRTAALGGECQSDLKRTAPLLRMQEPLLQPIGTVEQGAQTLYSTTASGCQKFTRIKFYKLEFVI